MLLWAQRVSRRRLNLDLGIEDMAELDRLHESGDLEVFFTERALAEREKLRAEGIERGIAAERERAGWRRASSMRARRSGWRGWRGSTIRAKREDWIIECASGDGRHDAEPAGHRGSTCAWGAWRKWTGWSRVILRSAPCAGIERGIERGIAGGAREVAPMGVCLRAPGPLPRLNLVLVPTWG